MLIHFCYEGLNHCTVDLSSSKIIHIYKGCGRQTVLIFNSINLYCKQSLAFREINIF